MSVIELVGRWIFLFALYGFLGWCLEAAYRSLVRRQLVNPGFLHGPFLPIYGIGAVLLASLDPITYELPLLIRGAVAGTALALLEYVVGFLTETLFHVRLWDYSKNRLNLHGRVCLAFSFVWAALGLIFVTVVHPFVSARAAALPPVVLQILVIAFVAYLSVDFAASTRALIVLGRIARRFAARLPALDIETENIAARVRRLRRVFPYLNGYFASHVREPLAEVWRNRRPVMVHPLTEARSDKAMREEEYDDLVRDIMADAQFVQLKRFFHHNSSIFDHAVRVSRSSYRVSCFFGLDRRSTARGALLHDFFLYDWRKHDVPDLAKEKFHGFAHPGIALKNAERRFDLNAIERDIIVKHMWPLTLTPPRYLESFVVTLVDKAVTVSELMDRAFRVRPNEPESVVLPARQAPGGRTESPDGAVGSADLARAPLWVRIRDLLRPLNAKAHLMTEAGVRFLIGVAAGGNKHDPEK